MEIKKPAVAGTLESSDCLVTVEPAEKGIEFSLDSVVINQFGNLFVYGIFDALTMVAVVILLAMVYLLLRKPKAHSFKTIGAHD